MGCIGNYETYCRLYDAGKVRLNAGCAEQISETIELMGWTDKRNLFARLFGKSRDKWFLERCRHSREGFEKGFDVGVDFWSNDT